MKEVRILFPDELRALCITKNWFTSGNNKQYAALLEMANKENITTKDIVAIAEIIQKYSRPDGNDLAGICFEIARECISCFKED